MLHHLLVMNRDLHIPFQRHLSSLHWLACTLEVYRQGALDPFETSQQGVLDPFETSHCAGFFMCLRINRKAALDFGELSQYLVLFKGGGNPENDYCTILANGSHW